MISSTDCRLVKRTSFSDPGPQSARHSSGASGPGPQSAPGPRKLGVLWGDDTAETESLTVVKRTSLFTRLEGATHLGGHMLGLGVLAHLDHRLHTVILTLQHSQSVL